MPAQSASKKRRLRVHPLRAVTIVAALSIIAIIVSVTLLLWDLRTRAVEHSTSETVSLARMLIEQTEQAFNATDLGLRGVQERLDAPYGRSLALDSQPVRLLLSTRAFGMRRVSALFVVDSHGNIVNSSLREAPQGMNVADRDYFLAFAKDRHRGLFIGRPVHSRLNGAWTLHLSRRLDGPGGELRGVLVAAVHLNQFEQLYGYIEVNFVRPIALYLADGSLVASLPHREAEIGAPASELEGRTLPKTADGVHVLRGVDSGRATIAIGRVAGFPLLVSVTDDEVESLAGWRETAAPIAIGAVFVCTLIGLTASLLSLEFRREKALTRMLREVDDGYRRTIDSVMDAIIAVDETQRIIMFNPAAEQMFGIPARQAAGRPLSSLLPERLREAHEHHLERFMRSPGDSRAMAPHMEITGRHADGREFPIESTISRTLIGGRLQLTAVLRDVSERRRVEADLREMNRELRRLSETLQSVREEERTRISRELHDELGQQLTGLKLELSWWANRLKEGKKTVVENVDYMRHALDAAIASVRRISAELRPRILDDLGFGEAVAWQVEEFTRRTGIEVDLDLPAAALVRHDAVATALFRIVQESLTNTARHARATRVAVKLVADDGALVLRVTDDGDGFDTDERKSGIGLVSMRERATALGGVFSIHSSAGAGTVIEVVVPVDAMLEAGMET